jgi:hypothetical protein
MRDHPLFLFVQQGCRRGSYVIGCVVLGLAGWGPWALALQAGVSSEPSYEKEVRPILRAHCTHCHGEEEKPGGGVDLRLRRFMERTTKDGEPLLVAGHPEESGIWRVVEEGEMPKKGKKLTAEEKGILKAWIQSGAKVSRPEPESLPPGAYVAEEDRGYWAFQPVGSPAVPRFADAPSLSAVDSFVREKLKAQGLDFAPEVSKAKLIRRLSLDLTGLPPTPEEVAAFEADARPEAYASLVDRLLASPHYGERWARYWLDVGGYSDTNGYADADSLRPHIWRYRDYVIRSLNADKPWDRFIQEQLAGDELMRLSHQKVGEVGLDPARQEVLAATGFLRLAPDGTGDAVADAKLARNQSVADTMRVVSTSLLGLSVACAQCHDHRYDPISQADYYRFRAIFDPALNWEKWRTPNQRLISLYTPEDRAKAAQIEKQAAEITAEAKRMEKGFLDAIFETKILEVPEPEREAYRAARGTEVAKRTPEQAALLKKYPSALATFALDLYDRKAHEQVKAKLAEAAKVRATKPVEGQVLATTEVAGEIPVTRIHHRGDHEQLRGEVAPGEISVLSGPELKKPDPSLETSGRRLAYAQWLTSGRHPLVARVLMNRVWMHHFGRGIVNTPAEFGKMGELPTHPELLDYLASRFVASGWSLKAMHREMVLSRTYRQDSVAAESVSKDPENRWLGRFRLRRLDAESVRDSILACAGLLNPRLHGEPVSTTLTTEGRIVAGMETRDANGGIIKVDTTSPEVFRRSIYLQLKRKAPVTVLETFDLPVMDPNCELRASSTVAPQALFLMNDDFVVRAGRGLAERVRKELSGDVRGQVRRAWALTQGRAPSAAEESRFLELLAEQTESLREYDRKHPPAKGAVAEDPTLQALGSLCQALLASNHLLHLE